jgi:hypothetical protein
MLSLINTMEEDENRSHEEPQAETSSDSEEKGRKFSEIEQRLIYMMRTVIESENQQKPLGGCRARMEAEYKNHQRRRGCH